MLPVFPKIIDIQSELQTSQAPEYVGMTTDYLQKGITYFIIAGILLTILIFIRYKYY